MSTHKKTFRPYLPVALFFWLFTLLFSCLKEEIYPKREVITKGQKWSIKIGSSPSEVYQQLQELTQEKNFNSVNLDFRMPLNHPSKIKSDLRLYNSLTLSSTSGPLERIFFTFEQDQISAIEKGGGLLDSIDQWPETTAQELAIHRHDSIVNFLDKLNTLYTNPLYQAYQIILPPKPLSKPFDMIMEQYYQWSFAFSEQINTSEDRLSQVTLIFENGQLTKLRHDYNVVEKVQ